MADAGLTERATFIPGDFFGTIPGGNDLYLLKSVIHNWNDSAAASILRGCRRAMTDDARIIVIERVIPAGNVASEATLFDINMLVVLGSQERTEQEYRALLHAAGFELTRVVPTRSAMSLIEGVPSRSPDDAMIAFRHLGKTYGAFTAVRDLAFSVERGEVFGFLGPNGAGKTTTIRMLMGILVPSSGSVTIDGLDCQADRVELKRRVGYLPDNPIFYDYLRGREILQFVGEMHGHARREAERRTAALLEELALDDAAEEYAVNYSTGMKKKLGLACALIHDPLVLILDEPTNGLDPRAAREVQERLRISAAQGKTIFLSTHLLDMAERLCSRVGIIHKGEIVAVGPLHALQEKVVPGGSLEEVFLKVTQPDEGEESAVTRSDACLATRLAARPAAAAPRAQPDAVDVALSRRIARPEGREPYIADRGAAERAARR